MKSWYFQIYREESSTCNFSVRFLNSSAEKIIRVKIKNKNNLNIKTIV